MTGDPPAGERGHRLGRRQTASPTSAPGPPPTAIAGSSTAPPVARVPSRSSRTARWRIAAKLAASWASAARARRDFASYQGTRGRRHSAGRRSAIGTLAARPAAGASPSLSSREWRGRCRCRWCHEARPGPPAQGRPPSRLVDRTHPRLALAAAAPERCRRGRLRHAELSSGASELRGGSEACGKATRMSQKRKCWVLQMRSITAWVGSRPSARMPPISCRKKRQPRFAKVLHSSRRRLSRPRSSKVAGEAKVPGLWAAYRALLLRGRRLARGLRRLVLAGDADLGLHLDGERLALCHVADLGDAGTSRSIFCIGQGGSMTMTSKVPSGASASPGSSRSFWFKSLAAVRSNSALVASTCSAVQASIAALANSIPPAGRPCGFEAEACRGQARRCGRAMSEVRNTCSAPVHRRAPPRPAPAPPHIPRASATAAPTSAPAARCAGRCSRRASSRSRGRAWRPRARRPGARSKET